jgi:hypothetical protein
VVDGVEFVIITSGIDVLNTVSLSPLIGDTFGEVKVELQDWFIEFFSPFSSKKKRKKIIHITIKDLLHLDVAVSIQLMLLQADWNLSPSHF